MDFSDNEIFTFSNKTGRFLLTKSNQMLQLNMRVKQVLHQTITFKIL